MAWAKLGTTTLGSAGDTITVSGSTASNFYQYLHHAIQSGSTDTSTQMAEDTGNNYAVRRDENGTNETTNTSRSNIINNVWNNDALVVQYISNISGEEKLTIASCCDRGSSGAGNAPNRMESVGKYAVTTGQVTSISAFNFDSGDFAADSNLSVLGSDGTESMTVQDGAIYYDTDLNKEYILYNNTWTEI